MLQLKDIINVLEMDKYIDFFLDKKRVCGFEELYKYSDVYILVIKSGRNGRLEIHGRR